jgi:hypothetical protein
MRPGRDGHLRSGERTEFFDTAKSDSVGLSKSSVDGPRLGNTHFGTTDQQGRIEWIGITVANKPLRAAGLENCCTEDPAAGERIGLSLLQGSPDSKASRAKGYSE